MSSSDAKVSWARGFFRLWVFLSALWVILVGLIGYSDLPTRTSPVGITFVEIDSPLGGALTLSYGSTGWADSEYGGTVTLLEMTSILVASQENENPFIVGLIVDAVEKAEKRLSEVRASRIKQSIIAAIVVPLAFLTFGVVAAWVLRGFRPSRRG